MASDSDDEFFEASQDLPSAPPSPSRSPALQQWKEAPGSIQERRDKLLEAMKLQQQLRSLTRGSSSSEASCSHFHIPQSKVAGPDVVKDSGTRIAKQIWQESLKTVKDTRVEYHTGKEERSSRSVSGVHAGVPGKPISSESCTPPFPWLSERKVPNSFSQAKVPEVHTLEHVAADNILRVQAGWRVEGAATDLAGQTPLAIASPPEPQGQGQLVSEHMPSLSVPRRTLLKVVKPSVLPNADVYPGFWDYTSSKLRTEATDGLIKEFDQEQRSLSTSLDLASALRHPSSDLHLKHVSGFHLIGEETKVLTEANLLSNKRVAATSETVLHPWLRKAEQAEIGQRRLVFTHDGGSGVDESGESSESQLVRTPEDESETSEGDWASPILGSLEIGKIASVLMVKTSVQKGLPEDNSSLSWSGTMAPQMDETKLHDGSKVAEEKIAVQEIGDDNGTKHARGKRGTWGRGGNVVEEHRDSQELKELVMKIKDLDTGREFILDDVIAGNEMVGGGQQHIHAKLKNEPRVREVGTGREFSYTEFEDTLGISPLTKELERRQRQGKAADITGEEASEVHLREEDRQLGCTPHGEGKGKRRGWLNTLRGKGASSKPGVVGDIGGGPASVKVHINKKSYKELSDLRLGHEIHGHEGYISALEFSADGRFLASAGQDTLVKVWEVVKLGPVPKEKTTSPRISDGSREHSKCTNGPNRVVPALPHNFREKDEMPKESYGVRGLQTQGWKGGGPHLTRNLSTEGQDLSGDEFGAQTPLESVSLSGPLNSEKEFTFRLKEQAIRCWEGHDAEILDLSWSKVKPYKFVLSASSDKTVRLWHMDVEGCLRVFKHSDWVTCVDFSPSNKRLFVSGSLDRKVRLWSLAAAEHAVEDWTDLREWITAVTFTFDGQGVVVGSHNGSCRFYDVVERKLRIRDLMEIKNGRGKKGVGITRIQCLPGTSTKVLITTNDSRIRIYDGTKLICKYKGYKNTQGQMTASLSKGGSHIVCASEDSNVYVWSTEPELSSTTYSTFRKDKSQQYEYFMSENVIVAVFWPGHSLEEGMNNDSLFTSDVAGGNHLEDKLSEASHGDTGGTGLAGPCSENPGLAEVVIVTGSREGEIRTYHNFCAKTAP